MGIVNRLADNSEDLIILEGKDEEILLQGLLFNLRDIKTYLMESKQGNVTEPIENLLDRLLRNNYSLLRLFDKEIVLNMIEKVQEDTNQRLQ